MSFLDNTTADLAAVFLTDFGVAATLAGRDVRVIFDNAGANAAGMTVQEPQVQIATASVPNPVHGQLLVVPQGTGYGNYTVREHIPDGTGMSLLILTRVA